MQANDTQVGGTHYHEDVIQHWDLVTLLRLDYFQAQITRYLFRWRRKNGLEDLLKAKHYLDKYIEMAEAEVAGPPGAYLRGVVDAASHALQPPPQPTGRRKAAAPDR